MQADKDKHAFSLTLSYVCTQVSRLYTSITLGCPRDIQGRVLTNIDR